MFGFERGDRVRHVHEACNPYSGLVGTVTRFVGDGHFSHYQEVVWVHFENGRAGWVEVRLLEKIQ